MKKGRTSQVEVSLPFEEPLLRALQGIDRVRDAFGGDELHEVEDAMSGAPPEDQASKRGRRRRRRGASSERADWSRPGAGWEPRTWRHSEARSEEGDAAYSDARELEDIDESLLSEDERAYLAARRRAERKIELYRQLVKAALYTVPCLIFIFPVGVILLIVNAVKLGRRAYRELVEPELRDRLVAEEVGKRLDARVHAQRRALEGEHARSLEQLSASIAHEIRNPITAAKSLVQQMGEEPTADENVEYAQVALAELERVERSVSHLLRFARDEELRSQPLLLSDVVDSALETFRDRVQREGVEVERRFDAEGELRGDAEKLRRVAINLIGNAIDALADAPAGSAKLAVELGENLAGTSVWLRVRDNGPGMPDELRERLFEPFVTSKETGTGLGLPITRKLIESHGGEIEVTSEMGRGTEFVVTLPKTLPKTSNPVKS